MSQYTGANPDEVFVGNVTSDSIPTEFASLNTARLGDVALDIDGKRLPSTFRPFFIHRSEADAYDRIAMARFNAIRL